MFFSKPGEYEPCSMYSTGHLILSIFTIIIITIAIKSTKTQDKDKIRKIIRNVTIVALILEFIKIAFNFSIGKGNNPNTYFPCYYCSLLLYAGMFSSFGKGKIKRIGDVFLQTGAIIAGVIFLIFPTTSLPEYPAIHFYSIHSFLFHGAMIYLGILMNIGNYILLTRKDIKYYAGLVVTIGVIAYIINLILDSNLMFISKELPKTPLVLLYNSTGKFYSIIMLALQTFPPFYIVYGIIKILKKEKKYDLSTTN